MSSTTSMSSQRYLPHYSAIRHKARYKAPAQRVERRSSAHAPFSRPGLITGRARVQFVLEVGVTAEAPAKTRSRGPIEIADAPAEIPLVVQALGVGFSFPRVSGARWSCRGTCRTLRLSGSP